MTASEVAKGAISYRSTSLSSSESVVHRELGGNLPQASLNRLIQPLSIHLDPRKGWITQLVIIAYNLQSRDQRKDFDSHLATFTLELKETREEIRAEELHSSYLELKHYP